MNWKSVQNAECTGFNYSCQENPALRSCNQQQQQQVYVCPVARRTAKATVDVEDLGRCFEELHNVNYPVGSNVQKSHGQKIRAIYRGGNNSNRYYNSDRDKTNGDDRIVFGGKDNRAVTTAVFSPAEKTWSNIKEAFANDSEIRTNHIATRNHTDKMASYDSERKIINTNYLNTTENFRQYYEHRDGGGIYNSGEGYFCQRNDNAAAAWFSQNRVDKRQLNIHTAYNDERNSVNNFNLEEENRGCRIEQNVSKGFNFCTEDRWLRCPAVNICPSLDDNYEFNSSGYLNAVIPCMDHNSELNFYYGDDIGYLTPAEYQRYEENSLSNEKRKEKSRDAARCRRSRETNIFTELGKALPVPEEQVEHLDKASVMRLAIAYLKVRTVIDSIPESPAKIEPKSQEIDGLFLKALDGFMMVLSSDGDMVYLSENVSEYLGVSQMDMMGQNVYDYSHPCDHDELRECLMMKPSSSGGANDDKQTCNLFLRLKCTLTSKGRKVNLKSASYKVIHCTGHMVVTPRDLSAPPVQNDDNDEGSEANDEPESNERQEKGTGGCLVVVGCPVPHPSNIEAPLGRYTFLSKHGLNMKFTYADEKLAEYLGWDATELVGQSVFEFHHALDNLVLDKSFKSLFSKGQCETAAYRFLGKKGGYAWVVTQATLIHCAKQHKPLSVVCVNYILSGIECENEVYSARQLEARSVDDDGDDDDDVAAKATASNDNNQSATTLAPVSLLATVSILKNSDKIEEDIVSSKDIKNCQLLIGQNCTVPLPPLLQERPRPLSVTASLFRTQEKPQRDKKLDSKKSIDHNELFVKPVSNNGKILSNKNCLEILNKKESNKPVGQKQTDLVFQGKPVKYFSDVVQRVRPQVVTRSLFAPAPQIQEPTSRPPPQTSTASIFAPRTEDMNKGFLTFSEDQPGLTMLKDEPEDLTHLAPTPGDVCVPLEDIPFTDILDDYILGNDNYCPLLSPGLPNELRASELGESLKDSDLEESLRSSEIGESLADSDPFMYRDSPSSCSGSPNLLSPALSKSPGSIDSLCSPSGSGGGLSEDEMLMLSIGDVLADEELALRAPYIPMSDQDETLQLFISNDMVMWPQPPDKKPKWSNVADNSESSISSSLEQLLRTNCAGNVKKCNDHGGGLVDPADVLGGIYKKNEKEESTWLSKSERSHKRVHCTTSSFENDNKRLKCSEESDMGDLNISNKSCASSVRNNCDSNGSLQHGNSQLLQQLMSQQSPAKNRGDHSNGGTRGGGGGGGCGGGGGGCGSEDSTAQQHPQQQSNSVLMNLLVSGCDVRAGYICLTKQKPSKSSCGGASSSGIAIK